jgi:hypothetical protein
VFVGEVKGFKGRGGKSHRRVKRVSKGWRQKKSKMGLTE